MKINVSHIRVEASYENKIMQGVIFTQYYSKYRKYRILTQEVTCLALIPSVFVIYFSGSFTVCRNLNCDVLNLNLILSNLYIIYF